MRSLRLFFLFQRALWSAIFSRLVGRSPWQSLPFQADMIVRFLKRDWQGIKTWPIPLARAELASRPLPDSATKQARVLPAEGAPVPSVWVEPKVGHDDRVVLYLHGGS